jgi:hypothetical protein
VSLVIPTKNEDLWNEDQISTQTLPVVERKENLEVAGDTVPIMVGPLLAASFKDQDSGEVRLS